MSLPQRNSWITIFLHNTVTSHAMNPLNIDLLVLNKSACMSSGDFEHEVDLLIDVLAHIENIDCFCVANEVIDINNYKIINKPHKVKRLAYKKLKPFVFFCNKN